MWLTYTRMGKEPFTYCSHPQFLKDEYKKRSKIKKILKLMENYLERDRIIEEIYKSEVFEIRLYYCCPHWKK